MTARVFAIDPARRVVAVEARLTVHQLPAGWRWATLVEADAARQRGAHADLEGACASIYDLAVSALAGPGQLEVAALIAAVGARVRAPRVSPLWSDRGGAMVDVALELAAISRSRSAAFVLWRVTWLHALSDGNGRVGRAACYAVLIGADPALREAHRRRAGSFGRSRLTVPERLERHRSIYVDRHMNGLHAAQRDGDAAAVEARLSALADYLDGLVADQVAGRASPDDLP